MSLSSEREEVKYFEREMQILLKEEVALSREVLSNLSQQEYVLLIGDIDLSKELRNDYVSLTKQKLRFSKEKARIKKNKQWQLTRNNIQIRVLNEELCALHDKIEKQFSLNEHLLSIIGQESPLSKLEKPSVIKRKNHLITLDYPYEKG